jgi:hypothetical protein
MTVTELVLGGPRGEPLAETSGCFLPRNATAGHACVNGQLLFFASSFS